MPIHGRLVSNGGRFIIGWSVWVPRTSSQRICLNFEDSSRNKIFPSIHTNSCKKSEKSSLFSKRTILWGPSGLMPVMECRGVGRSMHG